MPFFDPLELIILPIFRIKSFLKMATSLTSQKFSLSQSCRQANAQNPSESRQLSRKGQKENCGSSTTVVHPFTGSKLAQPGRVLTNNFKSNADTMFREVMLQNSMLPSRQVSSSTSSLDERGNHEVDQFRQCFLTSVK